MMKKLYSVFYLLCFFCCLTSETKAQALVELNGNSPLSLNSKTIITGGGAGFGFYCQPIEFVPAPRRKLGTNNPSPLCLRFGGYFYFSGAGHKTFTDVPLLSGTGNASVYFSNSITGVNFCAKFSSSLFDGKIIPYAEGYTGLRYFESDMTVDPTDNSEGSNRITIAKTSGINVGASGGMMFRINDQVFVNTGVMWSHSEVAGEFVDIRSLKRIGSSIGYRAEKLPSDFLVFKLGVTGCINDVEWRGNGDGWLDFLDHLFDNIGGSGGGGGNINLIRF